MHNDNENDELLQRQIDETVLQEREGVTIRLATITCPSCEWVRAAVSMYKCLYCKVWYCEPCAELHFGKTVEEWRREKIE